MNKLSIFSCAFGLLAISSESSASEIKWKVENRFPLFNKIEDFQQLENTFGTGSASDFLAKNISSADYRHLLPIHRTAWDKKTNTYKTDKLFDKEHKVRFALTGESLTGDCLWKLNNYPDEKHLCSESVVFSLPEGKPFDVEVSSDGSIVASIHEKQASRVS